MCIFRLFSNQSKSNVMCRSSILSGSIGEDPRPTSQSRSNHKDQTVLHDLGCLVPLGSEPATGLSTAPLSPMGWRVCCSHDNGSQVK